MGGGTTYQMPDQPSYGEGMADALKAQVQLLTGTGDFAETGSLESLLPLEESIRKKTAQTDTDILRQTLLGSGSDEKYAPDGRIITGYQDPPADASGGGEELGASEYMIREIRPSTGGVNWSIIDTSTGETLDLFNQPSAVKPTQKQSHLLDCFQID